MAPTFAHLVPQGLGPKKFHLKTQCQGVVCGLRDGPNVFRDADRMRPEPNQTFETVTKGGAALGWCREWHFGCVDVTESPLDPSIINCLKIAPAGAERFRANAAQHHHAASKRSMAFLD